MFDSHTFLIFGFALPVIILLFYVLCSKEAQVRLKPIPFPRARPAPHSLQRLPVQEWEESLFPQIALRFA